jgi:hypothetical protein
MDKKMKIKDLSMKIKTKRNINKFMVSDYNKLMF